MYWRAMHSLQPMQGRMSAALPARALLTISRSAMCARAMPTTSAMPAASTASASAGLFTRPVCTMGKVRCRRSACDMPAHWAGW